MERVLLKSDILLDDVRFLRLGFEDYDSSEMQTFVERAVFSLDRAMDLLKADPNLGARFLGSVPGSGTILWTGEYRSERVAGQSLGVRVLHKRTGDELVGDNRFGNFLGLLRDRYRDYLRTAVIAEEPVRDGQVVCDFTRKGAFRSDIEEREEAGERFIHVDEYRPTRFRFDSALDGTTGHASRRSDEDVSFQKFVCPFGTAYPSPIIVESAAEASFLYERALRGELDWKALFDTLAERGMMKRSLSERQKEAMASEYSAQFAWMREQISTNDSLKKLPIVASSFMVPDSSFGRSIYDAETAPSPAHVLARYINNPVLLHMPSENGVFRALSEPEKGEPLSFAALNGNEKVLNIVVFGSDTIGGREPGRKATTSNIREESTDESGRKVITTKKQYQIPQKSREAVEKDYAAFSSRMDSILATIPEGVKIRLVSGNSSSFSDNVGIGTPRLVQRYVKEKGGAVLDWNFSQGRIVGSEEKDSRVDALLMSHFAQVAPVLTREAMEVSFPLDEYEPDSLVSFSARKGFVASAALCFSDNVDNNKRNVMSLGSLAVSQGLPVIHIQDNATEEEQKMALSSGAVLSRMALSGSVSEQASLFVGEAVTAWELGASNMLSFIDSDTHLAVPFVANTYPSPVVVSGYEYYSAFGAFIALVAQERGISDRKTFLEISRAEGSVTDLRALYSRIANPKDGIITPDVEEKLLRQATRLMSAANRSFSERLLDLDARPVVMPVNGDDDSNLFVDLDGNGLNRFGIVIKDESDRMKEALQARLDQEYREREQSIQEANRRQKLSVGARAVGQKIAGGLPKSAKEAEGAVWFLGTNTPDQLVLPGDGHSFDMWDDLSGDDPLVREKASRPWVDDGEGGRLDNNYVFLFPSDLSAVTGKRRITNKPDSRDLTGVLRVDPKTGKEFVAAVGIPVRFNNRGNEIVNPDNMPCSYRLDNDASNYAESLVLADSTARATALRHGLALCLPGRYRQDGTPYYTLPQVFMEKAWNAKDRKWGLNPHRSSLNETLTNRYISLLEKGQSYPLNCVPLPAGGYREEDLGSVRSEVESSGKNYITAEGRFISDLLLSLRIANSTAIALGVPLRFPLDKDGRIDLGPGVPERFRALAERKIDSFIGVVKEEDLVSGPLPYLRRIDMYEASKSRESMEKAGTDLYLRANDLVYAFGGYNFDSILAGQPASLHEMAFKMDDGTVFVLVDAKSTRGLNSSDLNDYLSYSKNDERRFVIRTTDVDKVPQFVSVLKAYIERAKAVKVETRLLSESELKGGEQSLKGFVNLLSSNSLQYVSSSHDIGHEMTVFNGTNRFDGFDAEQVYWGHVDARDGFAGYAQIRYLLPDGKQSGWVTVDDQELAKDMVMSMVGRTYRGDERVVPSPQVMNMLVTAYAVSSAGDEFRNFDFTPEKKTEVDDKVVVLDNDVDFLSRNGIGDVSEEDRWFAELSLEDKQRAFSFFCGGISPSDDFIGDELKGMKAAVEALQSSGDEKALYDVYSRFSDRQKKTMMVEVSKSLEHIDEGKSVKTVKEVANIEIEYTVSDGGYAQRTRENANADDVDFTLAFATDFSTYGERCTAKAAGDSLIQVDLPLKKNGGLDLSTKGVKKATDTIMALLPDDFLAGEAFGVNIAGNGMSTLSASGVTQEQCDEFVVRVLSSLQKQGAIISSVRSGGQTGIDESGAVAGKVLGIPTVVHAPKNWYQRGADGRDISGEQAFKERFEKKDYSKLAAGLKGRKKDSLNQTL